MQDPRPDHADACPPPRLRRLAIIGCGLMGGSFALALKAAELVEHVVGYARSDTTQQRALALGVIDSAAGSAAEAARGADAVLLAVPVASTADTLRALAPALAPEALLMDVGSTKGDVVTAARAVLGSRLRQFVPAHPIAGKEKAGVEHASADLYRGCQVILTPLAETGPEHTAVARRLWQALGARVRTMTAADHDAAYAAVSHLPHLLAFAAVQALARQPQGAEFLTLAGPGFRDFTRIAASDPDVWRDILLANAGQVRQQAQHFRAALDRFEATLASGDAEALRALIAEASAVRSRWGLPPGTAEQADPPTRHVPHPLP